MNDNDIHQAGMNQCCLKYKQQESKESKKCELGDNKTKMWNGHNDSMQWSSKEYGSRKNDDQDDNERDVEGMGNKQQISPWTMIVTNMDEEWQVNKLEMTGEEWAKVSQIMIRGM